MRAEERHKMHRNELADWLGQWNERIKPYSNAIFIAILVVAVGVAATAYWVQQSRADRATAWVAYYRAVSAENVSELDDVARRYPRAKVGQVAALAAADLYLARGCQELFSNKSLAGDDLRKAVEHYRRVQDESREPMLLAQAGYGLGRAYEGLAGTRQSQGELQKAIDAYQQVVDRWPNGPYAELAASRLEDLQHRETRAFYDQFAQFEPQPARPQMPGLPGGPLPFDLGSLSEDGPRPGPTEPGIPDQSGPEMPPPAEEPAEPETTAPAESSAPPESSAPAESPPPPEAVTQPDEPAEPAMPAPPDQAEPQGPSESEPAAEASAAPEASQPEPTPAPEPAAAEKTPEPPPGEPAPDPQASPATEPAEASP